MKSIVSSHFIQFTLMLVGVFSVLGLAPSFDPGTRLDQSSSAVEEGQQNLVQEPPSTQEEFAVDSMDRISRFQQTIAGPSNGAYYCETCAQEEIANLRYGRCNDKNGYLKNQLDNISQQNGILGKLLRSPISTNSIIKPACIQASLRAGSTNSPKRFQSCGDSGGYGNAVGPACINESYFKLINNSFDLVSKCMKDFLSQSDDEASKVLDVHAIFSLVNYESGFHVNAVSGRRAGGIGQLTPAAITDVNVTQMSSLRKFLANHSNNECQELSQEFLNSDAPMKSKTSEACGRISLKDGNPIKNMIYTVAYLRSIKQSLDHQIFRDKNYSKKFNLSSSDMDRIRRALMLWAHNAGPGGTIVPVKSLLNIFYRNGKQVTNANLFIDQVQKYMKNFPARANSGEVRRRETSGYFPEMVRRLESIETNAGGGSCVN